VYFGGQTYTSFTYTNTYIAFSNLLILKMNKNEKIGFEKIARRGGGGDFRGRRGLDTEGS
jgi:hypothetical protein